MKGMILGAAWNAFLALIPLVSAWALARLSVRLERSGRWSTRLWMLPLGVVWLLFLPNTCYLMTEWRHFLFDANFKAARESIDPNAIAVVRVVLHAACFVLYSGFGVVCFALAIRPVEEIVRRWGFRPSRLAVPFFLTTSLGVYLGLIVRLNSWDLATRPAYVISVALSVFGKPALLLVLAGFAVVLWMTYWIVDVWVTGLMVKFRKARVHQPSHEVTKYRLVPR